MEKKTGTHGNHLKGKDHPKSKTWIIYHNDEIIGVGNSLREVGEFVGKSGAYMYQLYRGMHRDSFGNIKLKTNDGFSIRPADVIVSKGNNNPNQ